MPELPEVQTTVTQLARMISGKIIARAWMDPQKSINVGSRYRWLAIQRALAKKRITDVTRRAKYIVVHLEGGAKLWIHQKMTGHVMLKDQAQESGEWKYIRMMLICTDGTQIGLSDARRFARVILTRSDREMTLTPELSSLGPEPLTLSKKAFHILLSSRRGLIKPTLMNASVIAGIGNIYADEILHRASVHPFRPISQLSTAECNQIYRYMHTIITKAIRLGGSSTHDYRTIDGSRGGYQNLHRAYQRTGSRCTLCRRGTIERIVRNGRSSHFCPNHQR